MKSQLPLPTCRSRSISLTHRSRHQSQPKPPFNVPQRYISSRNNFTFQKQHIEAVLQSDHIKPRHKLKYSSVSIERASPLDLPSQAAENEEVDVRHPPLHSTQQPNCLYTMDFDFGKLDDSKLFRQLNNTLQASAIKQSQPSTEAKTNRSTGRKLNQSCAQYHPTSFSGAKQTSSKKSINKDYIGKSTRRSKMHWQSSHHSNVLAITETNLKFDKSIDPFEKKKLNSRIVTVAAGGKLQTKIYNYPDTSQYLKICGLLK